MPDKRTQIEKAEDAIERLKRHTREANEATADLRAVLREVKEYGPELVRAQLNEAVTTSLSELHDTTKDAIEEATNRVMNRFDKLAALLLGETGSRKDRYGGTIPEWVDRVVTQREREGGSSV
ncbi:hypothetical protein ACFV42_49185 [Streptomyces solisilvae]|uniref:hypothetical protein n=1 Tax=Streptomyces malaysiensis TaxID=92644 RepID=UPI0036A3969A